MIIWFRILIVSTILCACVAGALADPEDQLAGIRLGMTKQEVVDLLGFPSGKMKPLPPINEVSDNPQQVLAPPPPAGAGMPAPSDLQTPPNTLMFTYTLNGRETAVMIGRSTLVAVGTGSSMGSMGMGMGRSAMGGPPMPAMPVPQAAGGGPMGGPGMGQESQDKVTLPPWAYFVRALYLDLNQEQLIYKVNNNGYSIGITVTKQGDESTVTDIVVSSFEPLSSPMLLGQKRYVNSDFPAGRRPGSQTSKVSFPAKTSSGIRLGMKLSDVLWKQSWTPYCYPFMANKIGKISDRADDNPPVSYVTFVRSGFNDTVDPAPDFFENPAEVHGDKPIYISDGVKSLLSAGFTRNCLMLYPDDKVAYTLIDFTVVRIQVGDGVIAPPPPPKPPKVNMPGGNAGGVGVPGAVPYRPGPGGGMPPGVPQPPAGGGGGDVWF